jgi:hypothetical protein
MCDIPMDLERRFERRWAARFSGPAKEHRLEEQQQQRVTAPDESKRKTRRVEAAGFVQAVSNSVAPVAGARKIAVNFHVRVDGVALTDGA